MSSPAGSATAQPAEAPAPSGLPTVVTQPNRRPTPDDDQAGRRHSQPDTPAARTGLPDATAARTSLPDDKTTPRRSTSLEDVDEPKRPSEKSPLRPGDVGETHISFWDEEATKHFRSEWHEVKAEFVDDPVAALTRAHDLLTDAVNELTESLLAERDELDPLHTTATPDTESMRMAMRGYREFLDRILAL